MSAGTSLVSDFDGTLAVLEVDWDELRRELGVLRIQDLWELGHPGWDRVTEAEVVAARSAAPVPGGLTVALSYESLAVLTNNSERAVEVFLERMPMLANRVVAVMGRESLRGPKNDRAVFLQAMERLGSILGPTGAATYMGDQDYELDYAKGLVAEVVDVRQL